MITDKQFDDSFTSAGGWFFLNEFKTIYKWTDEKDKLIDRVYKKGYDSDKSGTRTRVNNVLRIIENNRAKEALIKIRDSIINKCIQMPAIGK